MTEYIPEAVKAQVRANAGNRCGYCLSPQHLVLGTLEIEHLVPSSKGGSSNLENLWLACSLCNNYKASQTEGRDPLTGQLVRLFNPRQQVWQDHFRWSSDQVNILGLTPIGRATVICLQLNNLVAVTVRTHWVAAGWHPPAIE